jgi:hypothetical protein
MGGAALYYHLSNDGSIEWNNGIELSQNQAINQEHQEDS